MKKEKKYIHVVRSCITGNVVWLYRGKSRAGAMRAYWIACKKELELMKKMPEIIAQRRESILKFLAALQASLPIDAELTEQQKAAAKTIRAIAAKDMKVDTEFYEHILEEARRRNEASGRWRDVRNKWLEEAVKIR